MAVGFRPGFLATLRAPSIATTAPSRLRKEESVLIGRTTASVGVQVPVA